MDDSKDRTQKEYSIGEVSRRTNMSLKTLRYYDKLGLLKPSRRDKNSGYRYYDEDVVIRLRSIKYYQYMGLSLEEIRDFLFAPDLDSLIGKFEKDLQKREDAITNAIMQKDSMRVWLNLLIEGEMYHNMDELPIGLRHVPKIETVFVYEDSSMRDSTESVGQVAYGSIYMEYPFLNKRLSGEYQHYIRQMEIHPLSSRHIRTNFIGDFTAISGIHLGPRHNIIKTYETMLAWGNENGFPADNRSFERYIIDETSVDREEDFVTEVLIPLKGRQ